MQFNRILGVALVWMIASMVPGYAMETRTSVVIQHNMGVATEGLRQNRAGFGIQVALSDPDPNTGSQQTALRSSKATVKDPIAAGPDGHSTSTSGNNSSNGEGPGNCDQGNGQKNNRNPHCAASPSS
jgi:hypothetical protein